MRLLDLFCGAGGAAVGYHRAGFTDIVGVDNRPMPRYPFTFVEGDALEYLAEHGAEFDVIHASPPCQRFSIVTPLAHRHQHPDLITVTRHALMAMEIATYVIENVGGARRELETPIMLCGSMFGLKCWRHRYFEVSPRRAWLTPPCKHDFRPLLVTTAGNNSRAIRKPGEYKSVKNAPDAYGIDWMTADDLKEAIPPAYTEWIGKQLLSYLSPSISTG